MRYGVESSQEIGSHALLTIAATIVSTAEVNTYVVCVCVVID